jgi:bacterioferritin
MYSTKPKPKPDAVAERIAERGVVGPSVTPSMPADEGADVRPMDEQTGRESEPMAQTEHPRSAFITDVKTLRERARRHIENGSITEGYSADRETVIKLLNEALATEIVCVLRYKRHYYAAQGVHGEKAKEEFLEHATNEQEHADMIAERITELGGLPNFSPEGILSRSHAEYVEGETLEQMIEEDLVAERIAIDSYRDMIRYLGDDDPTTRRMLEDILAVEEEHANDLQSLLHRQDVRH